MSDVPRKLLAEALGTALLLAIVIGSGIMAERLAGGSAAVALLANTLGTVGGLYPIKGKACASTMARNSLEAEVRSTTSTRMGRSLSLSASFN